MVRRGAVFVLLMVARCDAAPHDHAEPPPDPDATTGGTNVVTFAIDSITMGDGDGGWQSIGYDLDERVTREDGGAGCDLAPGETPESAYDGVEGRDNAFGALVVPIVSSALALAHPSDDETQAALAGKWTMQLVVTGLDGTNVQTASGLSAQLFASDANDGGASWPVSADSVVDGGVANAIASFSDAYVVGGTFVAGAKGGVTVPFHLAIGASTLHLRVHSALVTFDVLSGDEIGSGVLAGVLDPDELAAAVQGTFYRVQCDGTPPDNDVFYKTVDILADRTSVPGTPCTSVSFAIAFHGKRIATPTTVAPTPGVVDPCAD